MSISRTTVVLILLFFCATNVTQLKSRPATVDDLDTIKHLYGNTYDKSYDLIQTIESVSKLSPEHGPAYYVLLNVWRTLVGEDIFQARLLSVFLGLATISIAYRLALATGNTSTALSAALILAFLAYFHYYAQIARVYPLLLLVSGWLLLSYWRTVIGARLSIGRWLSLFAAAASALFVHYFAVVLLAAIAVHHLIFVPKNRRWYSIAMVMAAGCLSFSLWIPVVLRGYRQSQAALADTALPFADAALTIARIYANGLWFLPLFAAAALLIYRRRLNPAERYLAVVTVIAVASLLLINEATPILTERRMRYSLILAVPCSCALAIALGRLPSARPFKLVLLVGWLVASAQFASSRDLLVYTNQQARARLSIPHYQDFIYEAHKLPGYNELILSFHHSAPVSRSAFLTYYRLRLSAWTDIVHVSLDADDELVVESGLSIYASLDAIAESSRGIWLMHNPQESALSAMGSFADWLAQHFQPCQRFVDKQSSIIDFYLPTDIPCDLITDHQPFAVRYDNGTELANFAYELSAESLSIYLRWLQTVDGVYSFTLQLFDEKDSKVGQIDRVISGDPTDIAAFDLTDLPPGQYVARLVVYDRESLRSQPGVIASSQLAFERALDLVDFQISE